MAPPTKGKGRPPQPGGRRPPPPAGGRRPPPRKKKSAKDSKLPQVVLACTVMAFLGAIVWVGVYMAEKYVPEPPPVVDAEAVKRPKVEAKLQTKPLKRPGHLVMAPDQVYYPRATDVMGKPIEPVVNGLLERGVITCFADGLFRPNEAVPRAEYLLWCYNAVMAQTVQGPDPFVQPKKPLRTVEGVGDEFEDVDADHWAVGVLATLKEAKLFGDKPPAKVRPDAPLRREEWLAMAVGFAASREQILNMSKEVDGTKLAVAMRKLNYTDAGAVKEPLQPYLWFIVSHEKRKAWLADTFEPPLNPGPWHPNKPVTRGEAATFIGGFYEEIGKGFL